MSARGPSDPDVGEWSEDGRSEDGRGEGEWGAGVLSPQARARLARGPGPALRPPDASNFGAVSSWRSAVHAAWLEGDPPLDACHHWPQRLGGVDCLASPGPTTESPTIIYFHGGGYVLGTAAVSVPITERLSARANIISVDYRLAPEHPYPAAVDDARAVYLAVLESRPSGSRPPLVLAGDSAGANIALSLALTLRRQRLPGPDGLILLSPHLDHAESPVRRTRQASDDVDAATSRWLSDAYRGRRSNDDPAISPLRSRSADLAGLPPALVQVGSIDTAFDHGVRLARRLRANGLAVELDVWHGLWHTWHYHRELPEADAALASAADFAARLAR